MNMHSRSAGRSLFSWFMFVVVGDAGGKACECLHLAAQSHEGLQGHVLVHRHHSRSFLLLKNSQKLLEVDSTTPVFVHLRR